MSQRTPEAVMRAYLLEVVARGRLELIPELAHEDMVDEANQAFSRPAGRNGLVAHVRGFRAHIKDLKIQVQRIVAEEAQVMAWWTFSGIHAGPWFRRAPTQKPVTGTVFSFFELDKGLVRTYRLWLHADLEPPVIFDSSHPGVVAGPVR